jgi:hypothetical protein
MEVPQGSPLPCALPLVPSALTRTSRVKSQYTIVSCARLADTAAKLV